MSEVEEEKGSEAELSQQTTDKQSVPLEKQKILNALDFALAQMQEWRFLDAEKTIRRLREQLGDEK